MNCFSKLRRTGGRHNCITYLLTDIVAWPTAMPATLAMLKMFSQTYMIHRTQVARGPLPEIIPDFVVIFIPGELDYCPKFKFHHRTFNCLEVIVFRNKCNAAENIHLAVLYYAGGGQFSAHVCFWTLC